MQLIKYKFWFWKKQFYLFCNSQMEKSCAMMSFPSVKMCCSKGNFFREKKKKKEKKRKG